MPVAPLPSGGAHAAPATVQGQRSHVTLCPQLLTMTVPHALPQVVSRLTGVQHDCAWQTPVEHVAPSAFGVAAPQIPVCVLHVPAIKHSLAVVQTTGLLPTQVPA